MTGKSLGTPVKFKESLVAVVDDKIAVRYTVVNEIYNRMRNSSTTSKKERMMASRLTMVSFRTVSQGPSTNIECTIYY